MDTARISLFVFIVYDGINRNDIHPALYNSTLWIHTGLQFNWKYYFITDIFNRNYAIGYYRDNSCVMRELLYPRSGTQRI